MRSPGFDFAVGHYREIGRDRALASVGRCGYDLNYPCSENHTRYGARREVIIHRQGPEAIGSFQATTTLRQFFIFIENENIRAQATRIGAARVIESDSGIGRSRSICVGEKFNLQGILGLGRNSQKAEAHQKPSNQSSVSSLKSFFKSALKTP